MDDVKKFVGRVRETEQAIEAIEQGNNLLIFGRPGIGKSRFIEYLHDRLKASERKVFLLPSGNTKAVLLELARQTHTAYGLVLPASTVPPKHLLRAKAQGWLAWSNIHRSLYRMPNDKLMELTLQTLQKREAKPLVFFDSLEMPPAQAQMFHGLLELVQVVAGMSDINRRVRIQKVLWRFQIRLELKPLTLDDCTEIVHTWLKETPIRFSDDKTKARFIRHVASDSGGVPAAVFGMLEAASKVKEVTPGKARGFMHEAGIRYMDMTPAIVLVIVGFMAMRYISRGMDAVEMLVLSGVASALFAGLRFFMYRMSRR